MLALAVTIFLVVLTRSHDAGAVNIAFECPRHLPEARVLGTTTQETAKFLEDCSRYMWLSGEFITGDYERVRSALREHGKPILGVRLLASPGGNLDEAMKIGELVRRLRVSTSVAVRTPNGPLMLPMLLGSDDQAVCASACVYVWLSGTSRLGTWQVVIHRPYFVASYFGSLSPQEADAKYADIESSAYGFLQEMGAPEQLIEMMRKVSSSEGQILDEVYVANELNGMSPAFDEWLTSRCGADVSSVRLAEIATNANQLGGQEHLPTDQAAELARVLCRGKETKQVVLDAWENEFNKE